jgi:hypothetical protein
MATEAGLDLHEIETRLRGPRSGRGHSWGIRIGVDPFREVTVILQKLERATFDEVVEKYQARHGLNRDGSPKRSTVRAILQTLTHLGMVSIRDRSYGLSPMGAAFASAIGTDREPKELSSILLHYPAFRSIWVRIRERSEVKHLEISRLFSNDFFYAPRPSSNFAAFLIAFATEAGMLRKNAGTSTYEVVESAGVDVQPEREAQGEVVPAKPEPKTPLRQAPEGARGQRGSLELREIARELGLALADPAWLGRAEKRDRLVSQLESSRESLRGEGLSRIEKVAIELALQGLSRGDERALRWSVQCFNGLIEAGRA